MTSVVAWGSNSEEIESRVAYSIRGEPDGKARQGQATKTAQGEKISLKANCLNLGEEGLLCLCERSLFVLSRSTSQFPEGGVRE